MVSTYTSENVEDLSQYDPGCVEWDLKQQTLIFDLGSGHAHIKISKIFLDYF